MKIHLRQIPEEGLHLETEESADFLQLPTRPCPAGGPRAVFARRGHVEATACGRRASCRVDLEFECVRCLEPFVYPLQINDIALQIDGCRRPKPWT